MKIGIVDVGGGFRGIYACGALDYCLNENIRFDMGIGVSAGSANLASFIAGQKGRNYLFYTEYGLRKQYASLWNFIKKKSFIDMDYVYGALSNHDGENPLDYAALRDNPMELLIVALNAVTGEAKYFDKTDIRQDEYDIFKASSSIPFMRYWAAPRFNVDDSTTRWLFYFLSRRGWGFHALRGATKGRCPLETCGPWGPRGSAASMGKGRSGERMCSFRRQAETERSEPLLTPRPAKLLFALHVRCSALVSHLKRPKTPPEGRVLPGFSRVFLPITIQAERVRRAC